MDRTHNAVRPSGESVYKMVRCDCMPSGPESRLWPAANGPGHLAEIERVPLDERGLPPSTYELLCRAENLWPDRSAVLVMVDGEQWDTPFTRTFAELAADVRSAAGVLTGLGVVRDEAVAVISVNCAELVSLLLAAEGRRRHLYADQPGTSRRTRNRARSRRGERLDSGLRSRA